MQARSELEPAYHRRSRRCRRTVETFVAEANAVLAGDAAPCPGQQCGDLAQDGVQGASRHPERRRSMAGARSSSSISSRRWCSARGFAPALHRGQGAIVNITSIAGHAIHPFAGSAYSTSKAALSALTREMAVEFAELGVRVNAVAPGEIETAMVGPEYESLIPRIPMHRMGTPEEVAAAVFQLCERRFQLRDGHGDLRHRRPASVLSGACPRRSLQPLQQGVEPGDAVVRPGRYRGRASRAAGPGRSARWARRSLRRASSCSKVSASISTCSSRSSGSSTPRNCSLRAMISLLTSPIGPRSAAFSRRFSSARPFLGDGEKLALDRHRQLLDLQELDGGAEQIEGGADEARAQMAHLAGKLGIAAWRPRSSRPRAARRTVSLGIRLLSRYIAESRSGPRASPGRQGGAAELLSGGLEAQAFPDLAQAPRPGRAPSPRHAAARASGAAARCRAARSGS